MRSKQAKPSARVPALATAVAIIDLGACFASVADRTRPASLMITVIAEMILIGCAVFQWYLYGRAVINSLQTTPPHEDVASVTEVVS